MILRSLKCGYLAERTENGIRNFCKECQKLNKAEKVLKLNSVKVEPEPEFDEEILDDAQKGEIESDEEWKPVMKPEEKSMTHWEIVEKR